MIPNALLKYLARNGTYCRPMRFLFLLPLGLFGQGLPVRNSSLWLIEIEKFMNPLRKVGSVSQFSPLLLLSLYSYHVRELLICWLFFPALFAALAFLVLTGALACYAGKHAIQWVSATPPVEPVVGFGPDDLCLTTVPDNITLKETL